MKVKADKVPMDTVIMEIKDDIIDYHQIEKAAKFLQDGKLVAFPTETVYGIGANALDQKAVANIFVAKGRPADNPLIIHLAGADQLETYVEAISDKSRCLIEAYWPGPLTLIFKKKEVVPAVVSAGLPTVAIRVPSHPVAHQLLSLAGCPVAAPSANLSGKPSPTEFAHVEQDLAGKVDMIISDGRSLIGLESTVVDMTQESPVLLRPGAITRSMLEKVIGPVTVKDRVMLDEPILSPGLKYRHYSPNGQIYLVEAKAKAMAISYIKKWYHRLKAEGKAVAVLVNHSDVTFFEEEQVYLLGDDRQPETIGRNLYASLREMDYQRIDHIFMLTMSTDELGHAIMNRLTKAAGGLTIDPTKENDLPKD